MGTRKGYKAIIAYNIDLAAVHRQPACAPGDPDRPDLGHDAGGHHHGIVHGAYLQHRLHEGRKGLPRFFSFLSLFTFSMLGLVLATNIFQMYIFWELVGVSSFLLIGFYYQKPSAVAASKKAFIVTRFADLGFLIGILMLSYNTDTFDFQIIADRSQRPCFHHTGGSHSSWHVGPYLVADLCVHGRRR